MADDKKKKKDKVALTDNDHPALIVVSGSTRLRVLEDIWMDRENAKWKTFSERWEKLKEETGYAYPDAAAVERVVASGMSGKTDAEKAEFRKNALALIAMDKAAKDDRWHIREKHEREVRESVLKQARYVRELTAWERFKNSFSSRKLLPVDVAMTYLLDHIELTSTEKLQAVYARVNELEAKFRKAGQYKKADAIKGYKTILVEEMAVASSGFNEYITEENMIDFIHKSERGVTVDFLADYEEELPDEVLEAKTKADSLMVFDNYVVAHYSDIIRRAALEEKRESADREKKAREKRRDPIMFGIIRNSRKLYHIASWVTEADDLTLEKLERELGVTRMSVLAGASTAPSNVNVSSDEHLISNTYSGMVRREVRREVEAQLGDILDSEYISTGIADSATGRILFNGR